MIQRFVAYLDILGFKNLVQQKDGKEVLEIMEVFREAVNFANSIPVPDTTLSFTTSLIHLAMFSDSVILYTDGIESHDFFRIVHVTKSLIASSLICKAPLRGSIAHGEFYADEKNEIFFGKALLEAYKNEGKQQWAGAYICENTMNFVLSQFPDTLSILKKFAYLVEYPIPFKCVGQKANAEQSSKNSPSKHNLVLNWANMAPELKPLLARNISTGYPFLSIIFDAIVDKANDDSSISEEDKKNMVFRLDRTKIEQDILDKWDNTRSFFNYAKDKGTSPLRFSQKPNSKNS